MLYGRARGGLPYSPAEGLSGCGAELAQGLSYLSRHRQQLCGRGLGVCRDCVHYVVVLHRFGRATGGWASLAIIGNSERERGQNAVIFRFGELMNLAVFPLAKLEWTSTTGKGT